MAERWATSRDGADRVVPLLSGRWTLAVLAELAMEGRRYQDLYGALDGVDYEYRDTGSGAVPLVLLQHFRGNLDNWDPVLIDALASTRRVVTFDNAGVGGSNGTTPDTIGQMARDSIAFLAAMRLDQADLLGFSVGSFVAQEIALTRPGLVRRLILASSAPQGAAGMHGWAADVIGAAGAPEPSPEGYLGIFFTGSAASRQAGREALQRMYARTQDRDKATTWQTRLAQYDAVCDWESPITRCCRDSAPSASLSWWPTATATR
jgi:pimeloyl-ACP methyl ester carboxylesterase